MSKRCSGEGAMPLQSSHFGHCPPNPVDDESDFRHRTRLGFDGVELTETVSHLILDF